MHNLNKIDRCDHKTHTNLIKKVEALDFWAVKCKKCGDFFSYSNASTFISWFVLLLGGIFAVSYSIKLSSFWPYIILPFVYIFSRLIITQLGNTVDVKKSSKSIPLFLLLSAFLLLMIRIT